MRSNVLTIDADRDAAQAAAMMIEYGISGLPVIEGGKLAGIITKTDLVRGIANVGV
jgi:CBS domain-containing protein